MKDDAHWANLETKLDQAICELMFADPREGAPTLGVLLGMLRLPGGIPVAAGEYARKIRDRMRAPDSLSRDNWLVEMGPDERRELSNDLVAMLRFVCHRGKWP